MGKTAKGSGEGSPRGPVDWQAVKREILGKLDVAAEYAALGVEFTRATANAKGWRECHAVGRKDAVPSAAVHVTLGLYRDLGGSDEKAVDLFTFALRHGGDRFGRWIDALKHYADRAGVAFGRPDYRCRGRILDGHFDFRDASGAVAYRVFRYITPKGGKDFTQHPPDGKGGWKFGAGCMDGVSPLPYRLPELLASAGVGDPVWIVEGERKADRLAAEGLTATTGHGGCQATGRTWGRFEPGWFRGRDCVVLPDNDAGGKLHARKVAAWLRGAEARSVRVIDLPDLGPKDDIINWLDAGHDLDELGRLAHDAPEWEPGAEAGAEAEAETDAAEDDRLPPDEEVVTVCLADVKPVAVEWLWPDRIPVGKVTIIAGEAKQGKSFFTMDLAARVSAGLEIPLGGGECMPRGSVVLLSAEDGLADTIRPRLDGAGADVARVHALTTLRLPGGQGVPRYEPFTLAYVAHLERLISRLGDVKLVIIDPISHYVGSGTDDHKAVSLRAALGPLGDLATRSRVAMVLVHHLNKGNGTKAMNRVSGSGAYTALARCNWLVIKDPEDAKRRLFLSAGTNLVEEPSGLGFRIDSERKCIAWEDRPVLMTADEALCAERDHHAESRVKVDGNASKVEQAEAWLTDLLANGADVASDEIFKQGEAKGFSRKTLFAAKERAGIKAHKSGFRGGWAWRLPAEAHPDPGRDDGGDSSHSSDENPCF